MTPLLSRQSCYGTADRNKPFFGATLVAVFVLAIGIPVMMILELIQVITERVALGLRSPTDGEG